MNANVGEMERFYMALADQTRLRILNLMRDGEVCVNYLSETLGDSQPKISRHLAYLRKAGLVKTRRDGKWIYYSIYPADIDRGNILQTALDWLMNGEQTETENRTVVPKKESSMIRSASPYINELDPPPETRKAHNDLEEFLL